MKLGFVINPVAGMGGKVGLKGTDGVLDEAVARGAKPVAPKRAAEFLKILKEKKGELKIEVFTCPGVMGERAAKTVSFPIQILPMKIAKETNAQDTKNAVNLLAEIKVDLIVFVGGDGTAKDVFDAVKEKTDEIAVLGVPSGVKMYSGIFAVSPSDAVEIVLAFFKKQCELKEFEIIDTDENAIRTDNFSIELYGLLKGPFVPTRIQGSKQISSETTDEKENQIAIARYVIEEMRPHYTYILGPGTTIKCIAELLGIQKTLLGVDIYKKGIVILDVNEKKIFEEVDEWKTTSIILSPIGRQGILLGRGNQQISPKVIKQVGKRHILIVATKSKLQSIDESILRVDTGDAEADGILRGFIRVLTDYREWRLLKVE